MTLAQKDVDEAVERVDAKRQTMYGDLLAAQSKMPALQKNKINPHFGNKYVPLEELIQLVVPVLNEHNFILTQLPTTLDGKPALETRLIHASGAVIPSTMLLLCAKDDPQGQGSAITYARRYSLMSLLGLAADLDDDGEKARVGMGDPVLPGQGRQPARTPAHNPAYDAKEERLNNLQNGVPKCADHGPMRLVKAGVSKKSGKAYSAFYGCVRDCKSFVNESDWLMKQAMVAPKDGADADLDDLPNER